VTPHVKSVKHTCLVRNILWIEIFVLRLLQHIKFCITLVFVVGVICIIGGLVFVDNVVEVVGNRD